MAVDEIQRFLETSYSRYRDYLLGIIQKYLGECDACEDVFQDVFVKIIRSANLLCNLPPPKLEAYITLIARGTSIDYLRKTRKHTQIHIADDESLQLLAISGQITRIGSNPILKVDLSLMMKNISAEEQFLLIGKYYLGLSLEELAGVTKTSTTAIKSQLHRARNKLLAQWQRSGLSLGDFINE